MAMMRPRRPTFRTQPSFRPVYQDFKPKSDMTENPEAHVLLIHLPGFTKERIKVQYDDSSQLMRVSGERPIGGGNRRSRFREAYPVPQNCNINKIQSNFRQGILTIIMTKKIITEAEVKPTQEQALAGSPTQKAEQAIPPKSAATQEETRGDEKTASSPSTSGAGHGDMNAAPSQRPLINSQKPKKELTTAVPEKKADGVPQEVTEETEPKPALKLDRGKVEDEKPKMVQQEMDDEKPQKGQEETEAKPKLEMAPGNKMDDEKPQKGQEETEPKPISEMVPIKPLDEKPERGQEGTNQNGTLAKIPGEQSDEKPEERRGEDAEKERISNKEIIEEKPSGLTFTDVESTVVISAWPTGINLGAITEREPLNSTSEIRLFDKEGKYSVPKIPEKGKETTIKAEAAEAAAAAKERNLNDGMMRPRRPTFRTQPSFRPSPTNPYLEPNKFDVTENPEAHVLLIHLPVDEKTASSPSTSGAGHGDMKATPSQRPVIDSQKPEKELTTAGAEKKGDGVPQKVTEETEPSGEKPEERRGEDAEKERISNKEIIEEKHSVLRYSSLKVIIPMTEKEPREIRVFDKAGKHSVSKIPEKGKETTIKAEAPDAAAAANERNLNDGMMGTIGKGIKEVTTSASQAITRTEEGRWDNDDKTLLLNIGASILVLAAVGGYALYRFTSS